MFASTSIRRTTSASPRSISPSARVMALTMTPSSFHDKEAGASAVTALISLDGFRHRQRGGQYRDAWSQEDCLARIENPLDENRSGDRIRRQSVHCFEIRQTPFRSAGYALQ